MELELSSACRRALDFAFHLALEEGKMEPEAKHCIFALLNDPEGPVANLLKDFGLHQTKLEPSKTSNIIEASSSVFESAKKPHISKKILQISKKVLAEQEGTSLGFLVYLVEDFNNTQIILESLGVQWEQLTNWIDQQRVAPLVLDGLES
jgi:ATP-dependent Clp protease ATP-binding subunit ClpA